MSLMKVLYPVTFVLLGYQILVPLTNYLYQHHGMGDQHPTFMVVFMSFLTPALVPMLQFKSLLTHVLLPASGLNAMEGEVTYAVGRYMLTPMGDFNASKTPPAPDYTLKENWAMHPRLAEASDAQTVVPPNGGKSCEESNECNICTAFYLHPSTWYTSASWNAPAVHPVTSYLSDDAIGPQHANAFNRGCRIFAPRFRQMAAAGFLQEKRLDDPNSKQALDVAYSDVKRAFAHFLKHHHKGEPIFVAGHSQGALLGHFLVQDFFRGKELQTYLGAAYLVGWTIFDVDYDAVAGPTKVHVCDSPTDTGCVISWRTYARGGDPTQFLHVEHRDAKATRICVNPLSWKKGPNTELAPKSMNLGGLDVFHYLSMWRYLIGYTTPKERCRPPSVVKEISDAQCQDGHLFIESPKHWGYGWGYFPFPAWTIAGFPGMNLHTYDFNFFFVNVRENVHQRALAWWKKRGQAPKNIVGSLTLSIY